MRAFLRRLATPQSLLGAVILGLFWWLSGDAEGAEYVFAIQPILGELFDAAFGLPDATDPEDVFVGGQFTPTGDPVLVELQRQALLNLGRDPAILGTQGGPAANLLNALGTGAAGNFRQIAAQEVPRLVGLINEEIDRGLDQGLSKEQILENIRRNPTFGTIDPGFSQGFPFPIAGIANLEDLVSRETDFQLELRQRAPEIADLRADALAGREAALRQISQLRQDFPVPSREEIDLLSQQFQEQQRRERLQQANVGGFPVDLRGLELEGLQQALGLLGGQQDLFTGALGTLQRSLTQDLLGALSTQEQGQAAQLGAAQIAAAQASTLNDFLEFQTKLEAKNQENKLELFGTLLGAGAGAGGGGGGFGGGGSPGFNPNTQGFI